MSSIASAVTSVLSALSPSVAEIATTLGLLNKIPTPIRTALLQSLSEPMLKQLATWSQTFVTEVNHLDGGVTDATLRKLVNPTLSDDFITTMNNSGFDTPLMLPSDLDTIGNNMTLAIKSQNWLQAMQVGFMIAGLLPAL